MNEISVYIWGAGGAGIHLLKHLKSYVRVLAFLDNDTKKHGSICGGFLVCSPEKLLSSKFDYVLIASTFYKEISCQLFDDYSIEESRVVNIHQLFYDHSLTSRLDFFTSIHDSVTGISTGISYAMLGISEERMPGHFFNFALSGQDLYYDYKVLRHITSNYSLDNLQYVCIGMTRYSMHYDMSKRKDCDVVSRYIVALDDCHHAHSTYAKFNDARKLVSDDFVGSVYESFKGKHAHFFKSIASGSYQNIIDDHHARKKMGEIAQKEHKKHYPETFKENDSILNNMIELLQTQGVKPIFFCVPGHPAYTNCIPQNIERDFLNYISSICDRHNIPFYDKLRSNRFNKLHFYDDSHLNLKGAALFTSMFSDYLKSIVC